MRAYIIEYRLWGWGENGEIVQEAGHISQEGYTSLAAAQREIERRPNDPVQVTPMLYQTPCREEYIIHDILIEERSKSC